MSAAAATASVMPGLAPEGGDLGYLLDEAPAFTIKRTTGTNTWEMRLDCAKLGNVEIGGQVLRNTLLEVFRYYKLLTQMVDAGQTPELVFVMDNVRRDRLPYPGLKDVHISCLQAAAEIFELTPLGTWEVGAMTAGFVLKGITPKTTKIVIPGYSPQSTSLIIQAVLPLVFEFGTPGVEYTLDIGGMTNPARAPTTNYIRALVAKLGLQGVSIVDIKPMPFYRGAKPADGKKHELYPAAGHTRLTVVPGAGVAPFSFLKAPEDKQVVITLTTFLATNAKEDDKGDMAALVAKIGELCSEKGYTFNTPVEIKGKALPPGATVSVRVGDQTFENSIFTAAFTSWKTKEPKAPFSEVIIPFVLNLLNKALPFQAAGVACNEYEQDQFIQWALLASGESTFTTNALSEHTKALRALYKVLYGADLIEVVALPSGGFKITCKGADWVQERMLKMLKQ